MASRNARRPDAALTACRPPNDSQAGIAAGLSEPFRFRQEPGRLPVLAAKINAAHATVKGHIKATISVMMAAGDDLREAKSLAGHGKWLPWLKANCPEVSERTAHLYMQLAKWRSVVEEAMAKSAMVADLERDQVRIPQGLAVGPFGVVDAIAAIHEAEHHENMVKENRLKLAAAAEAARTDRVVTLHPGGRLESDIAVEIWDFTNHVKFCLSRMGTDQHKRAEFLKRARSVLDAMEAANRPEAPPLLDAISKGDEP